FTRLDRLVRLILKDPRSLSGHDLNEAAQRAGRKMALGPSSGLVDEAIDRLSPWLAGPFGERLRDAKSIERSVEWSLAWPADVANATVFHGRADFVIQEHSGEWMVVNVCLAEANAARERARVLLAARALTARV